jgi:hypothetical protein
MAKDKEESWWEVGQARVTAFPIAPLEYSSFNWWLELIKEKPTNRTELPRDGRLIEEGIFASKKLRLNIEPIRVDWFFEPSDEDESQSLELPALGKWPEAIVEFSELAKRWLGLDSLPKFRRLAFGAILNQSVNNGKEGYEKLNKYLPNVKLDPGNSSDFFYQINRPRAQSNVLSEVSVNRLSRWSVARLQRGIISARQMVPMEEKTVFACHLELDISTSVDYAHELDKLGMLYDEFVNLSIEISRYGDVK